MQFGSVQCKWVGRCRHTQPPPGYPGSVSLSLDEKAFPHPLSNRVVTIRKRMRGNTSVFLTRTVNKRLWFVSSPQLSSPLPTPPHSETPFIPYPHMRVTDLYRRPSPLIPDLHHLKTCLPALSCTVNERLWFVSSPPAVATAALKA